MKPNWRGREIATEAKKREVYLLLGDYRPFKSAFGGSVPPDEGYLRATGYGPGGFIEPGAYFDKRDVRRLAASIEDLDHALNLLRIEDVDLWVFLKLPFTGPEADPARLDDWRTKAKRGSEDCAEIMRLVESAVDRLAELLRNVELYTVPPKRSNSRDPESVEKRNDEAYDAFCRFRRDGLSRRKAVEAAAQFSDYSPDRINKIISVREPKDKAS